MGKILIPGGGGGADLDVITATAADVRKNKVIVDREGEPLAGTMKEMAGGTYTPGTADVVLVPANTFVTAPIIMKGDRNLVAGNIKKNVTIFNITGSHSGYVTEPADLYLRGNNPAGFTVRHGILQSGGIQAVRDYDGITLTAKKSYNFSGYSKIQVNFRFDSFEYVYNSGSRILASVYNGAELISSAYQTVAEGKTYTISLAVNSSTFIPIISLKHQIFTSSDGGSSWRSSMWDGWIWQVKMS